MGKHQLWLGILCAFVVGCAGDDTSAACGDGECSVGETRASCALDCPASGPYCGDGTCNNGENSSTCAGDCPASGPFCGDGLCNGTETNASCAGDCPTAACTSNPASCAGETICLNGACVAAYGRTYYVTAYNATIPQFAPNASTWDISGGAPDPLCKVSLNGQLLYTTSTKADIFTPLWNEGLPTTVAAGSTVSVAVEDEDVTTNDPIFTCTFPLTADLLHGGESTCSGALGSLTMRFITQ